MGCAFRSFGQANPILLILSKKLTVTPPPTHQFLRKFIASLMSSGAYGMAVVSYEFTPAVDSRIHNVLGVDFRWLNWQVSVF